MATDAVDSTPVGGTLSPAPVGGTLSPAGEPDTTLRSRPPENLTGDPLLAKAPRVEYRGAKRPALGGIPLLVKLGQGGMGAVYYGIHTTLDAEVAVKVLPLHLLSQNPEIAKRFIREAQIAGSINSANLIYVRDVGQDGGYFYQVMEYVHGVSAGGYLKHVIAKTGRKGLPETEALEICIAAAKGLAAAHARNIIHRDIKPDNILIPRARNKAKLLFSDAKVADLGLARTERAEDAQVYVPVGGTLSPAGPAGVSGAPVGETLTLAGPAGMSGPSAGSREGPSLTGFGAAMGTLGYMPAEQIDDARSAGKTADVFALGATLYALLAGHAPFDGITSMERLLETALGRRKPLAQERPDVSAATLAFVENCLQKDPAQRYADAVVLVAVLEECLLALKPRPVSQSTIPSPQSAIGAAPRPEGAHYNSPGQASGASAALGTRSPPGSVSPEGAVQDEAARGTLAHVWRAGFTQFGKMRYIAGAAAVVLALVVGTGAVFWMRAQAEREAKQQALAVAEKLKQEREAEAARLATAAKEKAEREAEAARVAAEKKKADDDAEAARLATAAKEKAERDAEAVRLAVEAAKKAETAKPAKELTLDLGKGVKLELVLIPAGKFMMGSPATENGRSNGETQHEVTISKPFYMGKFEVTQEQYEAVMGKNPSNFKGAKNPVERVSWDDAQEFVAQLAKLRPVRLPTEAEWEYACRAGTATRFYTGDGDEDLARAGWYGAYSTPAGNSGKNTNPVGQKAANAWGLYDMHGNVWEWCQDRYGEYAAGAQRDPQGAGNGVSRVLRGGAWILYSGDCRSANRFWYSPDYRVVNFFGFRVVVAAGPP